MDDKLSRLITAVLIRTLRPLVRITLRLGVPYHAFAEALKWVHVDVADRYFYIPGKKQTQSRISVITGLSRVEVRKQASIDPSRMPGSLRKWHRAGRVLSVWAEDARYTGADGKPIDLTLEEEADGLSFAALVEAHSGGATLRSILDELISAGAVERTDSGKVRLLRPYYLTEADTDHSQQLDVLGYSAGHLLETIEHNTRDEPEALFFQRLIIQEEVPESLVDEARRYIRSRGQELANDVDRYLTGMIALHEGKENEPRVQRLGMGLYYYETEDDEGLDVE